MGETIESHVDVKGVEFQRNREHMDALIAELAAHLRAMVAEPAMLQALTNRAARPRGLGDYVDQLEHLYGRLGRA